ncbi:glycoside hydrolase family 127 protein [Novipirellula artificiosorum]|nr:glycoside hydrolase family 127 protein [Novipirellula artificiosorum]
MKQRFVFILLASLCAPFADGGEERATTPTVPSPLRALPFKLGRVRLLPSEFTHARDLNAKYLLRLDPDRQMAQMRTQAGLMPKQPAYGGWLQGSACCGHYLTACALQYAATGDERFKQAVERLVEEMAEVQEAYGNGYLGSQDIEVFEQFSQGRIYFPNGNTFKVNDSWVPWYWQHKLFAGLIDAYRLTGSQKAYNVLIQFADWAESVISPMSDNQIQTMLEAEHGGMLESMVELYQITGEIRYLDLSKKFYHNAILASLADCDASVLAEVHANTQVPKFVGVARRYLATGAVRDRQAAENFFSYVRKHYTYVNGGNSSDERFGQPDQLAEGLQGDMTETCNTYNMLKLDRLLFMIEPRSELMDYYEHALYNHILASQHPESGMFTYKYKLHGGYPQAFSTPFRSFWCCVGSGMENHTKYAESIYFHDADSLWVNLFIPSELDWSERGLKLRMETTYPDSEQVTLRLSPTRPVPLTLRLRWPAWANGASLTVNGEPTAFSGGPGQYVTLRRTWQEGDTLVWTLPMRPRLERLPDDPTKVAITHGPVVLAAALGRDNIEIADLQGGGSAARWKWPLPDVPALTALDRPLESWLKPVDDKTLTFRIGTDAATAALTLLPSWRGITQRYAQYLDGYTAAQWQTQRTELARQRQVEQTRAKRLVDEVLIGNQQSEIDHAFAGAESRTGEFRGNTWRDAQLGGWFSYVLDVKPGTAMMLRVRYWGGGQSSVDSTSMRVNTNSLPRHCTGMSRESFLRWIIRFQWP